MIIHNDKYYHENIRSWVIKLFSVKHNLSNTRINDSFRITMLNFNLKSETGFFTPQNLV